MAKFKFETKEEKQALKARAENLKPKNVANLVATDRGWAQARPNGNLEILVSFHGLDELLGDIEPEIVDETPVEVNVLISVEHDIEKQDDPEQTPAVEVKEEVKPVEPVVMHKKAGRPAKKAD